MVDAAAPGVSLVVSAEGGGGAASDHGDDALVVRSLTFAYPSHAPLLSDLSLRLPVGARCLLCGANGGGKSTLLQVLGGKTMVDQDAVRVLGVAPFHTTALTCSGDLSYLGSQWRRTVASVGYDIPLAGDIPAGQMILSVPDVDPARRDALVALLGVDLSWSMNRVSDGQRRRVQICLGLLKPYKLLLCDEITVDLDVCARVDLLNFFRAETEERGATIIYATHIFDGMEAWPTHVAYVERGQLKRAGAAADVPELFGAGDVGGRSRLLATMETWLREERDDRIANATLPPGQPLATPSPFANRHMAYFR